MSSTPTSYLYRSGRAPPADYEIISTELEEFASQMREAEVAPHEGMRIVQSTWPILRINHRRSRLIYDAFYKQKRISRELYEWCLEERLADRDLIAKWKKSGYEGLCCLRCINQRETTHSTNCICRVPRKELRKPIECQHCGCNGCGG